MKRCLAIPVPLIFALALSCTAPEQSAEPLSPEKTISPVPASTLAATPLPTTASTTPLDSPPRGGRVRLADGRNAPVVRVVPRDLIAAVFIPVHIDAAEVGEQVGEASLVIGVSVGSESVAYSVSYLSSREIVNDTVGGTPIAVTW